MIRTLIFLSILCVMSVIPGVASSARSDELNVGSAIFLPTCAYRVAPDTQMKLADDSSTIVISSGEVLVEPKKNLTVVTPQAKTTLRRGAIVLFRAKTGIDRVMAVWGDSLKDVVVVSANSAARLFPGDEVTVTDHRPFYREICQSDQIARRAMRRYFVGDGLYMTTAEISLMDVLKGSKLARSMDRADRDLVRRVLKIHHILGRVHPNRRPYIAGMPLDKGFWDPKDPLSSYEDLMPAVHDHEADKRRIRSKAK